MKFCEECGAKLDDDSTFCEECGAQVATVTSATVENLPKQKTENETNVGTGCRDVRIIFSRNPMAYGAK